MDVESLSRLNELRRSRLGAAVLTDLGSGETHVIADRDHFGGLLGDAVKARFLSGRSGVLKTEAADYFLNVYLPPPEVVIIGAVHISQILAQMAKLVGYGVRIVDPRTSFATLERFAGVDLTADWPADAFQQRPLDTDTALVALTHDPKIDDYAIAQSLRSGCFYIGALGSRRTHGSRLERLKRDGFCEADLRKVHGPIGLDIGASQPAEIAVAILAEIIKAYRARGSVPQERPI